MKHYDFTLYLSAEDNNSLRGTIHDHEPLTLEINGINFKLRREILPTNLNIIREDFDHIQPSITKSTVQFVEVKSIELEPKKETMKKYRLVMPDTIEREDINAAYNLNIHNGSIVEFDSGSVLKDGELLYSGGPKEWLHEIDEEKVITFDEWFNDYIKGLCTFEECSKSNSREAFEAGERNCELRHRETESFPEMLNLKFGTRGVNRKDYTAVDLRLFWLLCNK